MRLGTSEIFTSNAQRTKPRPIQRTGVEDEEASTTPQRMSLYLCGDFDCPADVVRSIYRLDPDLLLERGTDHDDDGWTPLHYACRSGSPSVIETLLEDAPELAVAVSSTTYCDSPLFANSETRRTDLSPALLRRLRDHDALQRSVYDRRWDEARENLRAEPRLCEERGTLSTMLYFNLVHNDRCEDRIPLDVLDSVLRACPDQAAQTTVYGETSLCVLTRLTRRELERRRRRKRRCWCFAASPLVDRDENDARARHTYETMSLLLRATRARSGAFADDDLWRPLLHEVIHRGDVPAAHVFLAHEFCSLASRRNSALDVDAEGNLPLHAVCATRQLDSSSEDET